MKAQVLLIVQLVLAAMLMWTCFCRLVKTGPDTYREVRWAILFEGAAAGLVFLAPALPVLMPGDMRWPAGTTPTLIWLVLLLSVTAVQMVTAKHWRNGQAPMQFQQGSRAPGGVAFAMVLLALGFLSAGPGAAIAQQPDADGWREVEGDVVYMPPGAEVRCTDPQGCVAFTTNGLREVLARANGTCGRIPPAPAPQPHRPA